MGYFNIIRIKTHCSNCKKKTWLNIQFKYGENWMHSYHIGDEIIWGENNIGESQIKNHDESILVSAISEACPICNECSDYIVEIHNNVIQSVYADDIGLATDSIGYKIKN